MSKTQKVPSYLLSKTGELLERKFLAWVSNTQKRLRNDFPEGEQAFAKVMDDMRLRLPHRMQKRLWYNRQKYFIVAPGVVFFGDFYFSNMKLLIEVDGGQHNTPKGREKDDWRSKLIESWKVETARISNDDVIGANPNDVEEWFLVQCAERIPPPTFRRLAKMVRSTRGRAPRTPAPQRQGKPNQRKRKKLFRSVPQSLRPCINCGWGVGLLENQRVGSWTLRCDNCGCTSVGKSLPEVIHTWNERVAVPQLA